MGAFLGGLILGYSPYMLGILNNGRLAKTNHAWIQLVALAAWSLAHQRREGGATRWAALEKSIPLVRNQIKNPDTRNFSARASHFFDISKSDENLSLLGVDFYQVRS